MFLEKGEKIDECVKVHSNTRFLLEPLSLITLLIVDVGAGSGKHGKS